VSGATLQVSKLVAGYTRGVPIVRGLSLSVAAGEIVTVLGPNGAGKSTLVKAIAGLVGVFEGSICLDGADLAGCKTHTLVRAGVGFVPQTANVFERMSVQENLEIGGYVHRSKLKERLRAIYDLFPDLERLRHHPAGKLSGGQRQMVAIGRALMIAPKLLILDEPSAGLSPKLVGMVFQRVRAVRDTGVTILMVEQNAKAALNISDRGYVLAEGQERISDAAGALLHNPEVGELYLGAKGGLA